MGLAALQRSLSGLAVPGQCLLLQRRRHVLGLGCRNGQVAAVEYSLLLDLQCFYHCHHSGCCHHAATAEVIMAMGQVLEKYDTDRRYPVWGFGAGLPPSGAVSHCFSLSPDPARPEVDGIQGILAAYRQVCWLSSLEKGGVFWDGAGSGNNLQPTQHILCMNASKLACAMKRIEASALVQRAAAVVQS